MARFRKLNGWYWALTAALLAAGLAGPSSVFVNAATAVTALHAVHFRLRRGTLLAPPVQTRIGYVLLLLVGGWEPLAFIHWMQLAGTVASLTVSYCPMARMVSLMPWNLDEPFSVRAIRRAFLTPPGKWHFPARTQPARPPRDLAATGLKESQP